MPFFLRPKRKWLRWPSRRSTSWVKIKDRRLMRRIEREIIHFGKLLFERRLISGWGGNISCRLAKDRFLITGQHTSLAFLSPRDLVEIDRQGKPIKKKQQPSSETPLHLAAYNGTEAKAVRSEERRVGKEGRS